MPSGRRQSRSAVRADVFPAELLVDPDAPNPEDRRRVYPVRVIVTLDEIFVFQDASPAPLLVFRDGLVSYSAPTPAHLVPKAERTTTPALFHIATSDTGHALSFKRASGCGCGSRLKVLSLQTLLDSQTQTPTAPSGSSGSPMVSAASVNDR